MSPRRLLILTVALLGAALLAEAEAGPRSRPVRTGQATCYDTAGAVIACSGTGQDGELRAGEVRSYVDNGDGTLRDQRAGLTWEKLSNDATIHDKDNAYTWEQAFARIDDLNTAAFAGFTDWRLPNRFELETLVNLGTVNPAISAPFDTGCTDNCTVLVCSCSQATGYWSSTPYAFQSSGAWIVEFVSGPAYPLGKTELGGVRAVRGGS